MKQLKAHFQRILDEGKPKPNRKGEFDKGDSTLSVFGAQLRFDLSKGTLPVTTSKELKFQAMAKEIAWMIRGETNIKTLGCGIWDKWALKEDLVIRQPRPEHEIVNDIINKVEDVTNIYEASKFIFELVRKHTTIADGTVFATTQAALDTGNPQAGGVLIQVTLTKELLNPFNLSTEGVSVDYEAVDEELRKLGIEPIEMIPQFDAGYCGPIYGKQWRAFESVVLRQGYKHAIEIDQFMEAYRTLRDDIYSRRNIVSAWNPALITESRHDLVTNITLGNMGLPPCHWGFQLYVAGQGEDTTLSLGLKLRSSDSGVGLPFNIASYAAMAYILAAEFNLKLGDLVVDIGDAHIYRSHIDGIKEYIARPEHELPEFTLVADYRFHKDRVCLAAIEAKVDELTYDSPEIRAAEIRKEVNKFYDSEIVDTPAAKEALFKLFIDNIDYRVITESIKGYKSEPFIQLDLYD